MEDGDPSAVESRPAGRPVVIVGAGAAGTACALAAVQAGARVLLVDGGTGATTLSTGAIDVVPWDAPTRGPPTASPGVSAAAREILEALGGYVLAPGAHVATTAGIVRPASGHDAAVLDVAPFVARSVGVVRCDRPSWDAVALARAWGAGFVAVPATVLRRVDERVLPAADFAARHDDEARLVWLAERLRDAVARTGRDVDALVLPPSLGLERPRAATLSRLVGLPCGEAVGLPGGPSGLRFEAARDRALASARVERVQARVRRVEAHEDRWRVLLENGADGAPLDAAAVVLATGGLIGGGLEYDPAEASFAAVFPPSSRPPFRLALDAPAVLGAHGRPLDLPGSLFGIAPESLAWPYARDPLMDRVGVLAGEGGRVRDGLYVAGEVVADAPRTWLHAIESGVRAGVMAARHALTEPRARPSLSGARASRP
jgi:glycerol-3-phosphate dehydrogenase subunit B